MAVTGEERASITDAELSVLAMAGDPDTVVADDAVSLWEVVEIDQESPLPSWYMPAPMRPRHFSGWRGGVVRTSVVAVIASFVAINAHGLCNTYGQLHL